jgi:purine nucleosidase
MTAVGNAPVQKTPVILVHDAAIDEFMSVLLLTTMPEVDLLGIVVVNADCLAAPAMSVSWKLNAFTRQSIPVGLSNARGLNPFPWEYRGDCVKVDELAILKSYAPNPEWPPYPDGDVLLTQLLSQATTPVTLLVTSPLTPVAHVLQKNPALAKNVARLVWMGGAIDVGGNLDPSTVPPPTWNPYAEWNAFWDPDAVSWVFQNTQFPIVLFPLDITNQAAITPAFMDSLAQQAKSASYSALAYQSYYLVATEAFYDMWDVVTTCWLTRADLFQPPSTLRLTIDTALGGPMGTLRVAPAGREVSVVFNFADDGTGFYDYVLQQFNRSALGHPFSARASLPQEAVADPHVRVFNDQNFDAEVLRSDVEVLVNFTATWCGPCRALQPIVDKIADDYQGKLKVGNLDIDASPEMARKYGIRSVPTLLAFKGGSKTGQLIGLTSRQRILQMLGLA